MDNIISMAVIGVIAFVALLVVGLIVARLYKRASKERAFVRTGMGGQKVVKDGGALIIPVLHDTLEINMQTLKLEVSRTGLEALITLDRMRTDVGATFFVRVKPDENSIAQAAQTLGTRTQNPDLLKATIEDKFVDALRAVAAGMLLNDLHEKRSEFVQAVQNTVEQDLQKNGLELESVSLTRLDQTDPKFLNPNNPFDAEGLTNLAKITQAKARERNEIEQEARVAIEKRNYEANQESLTIKQQDEFARLEQEKLVETRRAEQGAEVARQRAEQKRMADIAQIEADRATELARIEADRLRREADIKSKQELQLAEQASTIAVNQKSEEESKARASADKARAEAVQATQEVVTAEVVAKAERERRVAIIEAEKVAGTKATEITLRAKAEAEAADMQAQARLKLAEVTERENEVRAAGERALADAANALSAEQVQLRIRLAAIEAAPKLAAEIAKPMAAVKNARVVSVTGLGQNGGAVVGAGSSGNIPNDLTNSLLNFRLQAPFVDEIGKMAGYDLRNGLNGLGDAFGFDKESEYPVETEIAEEAEIDEVADLRKLAGITSDVGTKTK